LLLLLPLRSAFDCHKKVTPNVVHDWELSKHSKNGVDCSVCHGSDHMTNLDTAKAKIPTPATCGMCHEKRVQEYKSGKHAVAWAAMNAMPTIHWQPMAMIEGQKVAVPAIKSAPRAKQRSKNSKKNGQVFGNAACDSCHTRHTFSVVEAKQPQACQTCHMGFDHPQWEMYSGSKHGVRYLLKQEKVFA